MRGDAIQAGHLSMYPLQQYRDIMQPTVHRHLGQRYELFQRTNCLYVDLWTEHVHASSVPEDNRTGQD